MFAAKHAAKHAAIAALFLAACTIPVIPALDADAALDTQIGGDAFDIWNPSDVLDAAPDSDVLIAPDVDTSIDGDADASDVLEVMDGMDGMDVEIGPPDVIKPFEYGTTCVLPPDPSLTTSIKMVDAFPSIDGVGNPMMATHAGDGSGRLFVVERSGIIYVVDTVVKTPTLKTFHGFKAQVDPTFEGGFLGLAFHPGYLKNGLFYTHYTTSDKETGFTSVVSEWRVSKDDPNAADPTSERVILTQPQPYGNHNGGSLSFGPDGFLYIGFGDGGSGGDPLGSGQDTQTWLGAILRIDINGTVGKQQYLVPTDNPFVGVPKAGRPEIYAWGLRNPWRFSFDPLNGAFWVADVGQNAWEEVDIVEKGGNYGWNTMEGAHCYSPKTGCKTEGLELPVTEYDHSVGVSITGGYVMRGGAAASLHGAYIYADYQTKALFAWHYGAEPAPTKPMLITPNNFAGFGQDEAGEVYGLGIGSGRIYRFEEVTEAPLPAEFPKQLSKTGCFDDIASMTPAAGVLPYALNHRFWSSGAAKTRWVAPPKGTQFTPTAEGPWEIPEGTVFIKHFTLEKTVGEPSSAFPVETRLLAVEKGGIRGYSYRWNAEGTEATLLDGAATAEYAVESKAGPTMTPWEFPSRGQCNSCHTATNGKVLGFETRQLAKKVAWGDGEIGQLPLLEALGLLSATPTDAKPFPAHDDKDAPIDARARAYLHVNCAPCHQAGGGAGTEMDLRATVSGKAMGICDTPPGKGTLGHPGASLLTPGDGSESVLWLRATAPAPFTMPPLATPVSDTEGQELLKAWIDGLSECPSP